MSEREVDLERLATSVRCARAAVGPELLVVAGDLPSGGRAGLLAGTFNPLTHAHVALARGARRAGWEHVVLVLAPESLDKETLERAHLLDRIAWTAAWARRRPWASVAISSSPLLMDMAEALRQHTGGAVGLVVGADKALQLADPRYYADPDAALERLRAAATILVAPRAGVQIDALPLTVQPLVVPDHVLEHSSTQTRRVAAAHGDLRPFVPAEIARAVRRTGAYDAPPSSYDERSRRLDERLQAVGGAPLGERLRAVGGAPLEERSQTSALRPERDGPGPS